MEKSSKNTARVWKGKSGSYEVTFYGPESKKISNHLTLPHRIDSSKTQIEAVERAKESGAEFVVFDHEDITEGTSVDKLLGLY